MPPEKLSQYDIGRRLAEGRLSVVYLAHDTVLDRQVALKVLKLTDAATCQKVLQVARLASSLDHPYICRVYDAGGPDDKGIESMPPYIAMEYIEGGSLADMLEAGTVDSHTLLRLGMQICEGLAFAHDRGIFHGHITGSNVLVNKECEAKLVDFGTAFGFRPGGTATARGDVWYLGNLLYQMLTGLPFQARLSWRSPGGLDLRELVSPGLAAIIERSIEDEDFGRGYDTAGEVLRDLQYV